MTLDTLREMTDRELTEDELREVKSTVRRYLSDYDKRVGIDNFPTTDRLRTNFSPTYRQNMFEAFTLYKSSRDDNLVEAIQAITEKDAEPLDSYLEE